MSRRTRLWLTIIVVVAFGATMIAFMPTQRIVYEPLGINRDISLRQGLDLSGGSQVLLEADNCATPDIAERLENTRQIIENRINGLGVTEPLIQMAGTAASWWNCPPWIIRPMPLLGITRTFVHVRPFCYAGRGKGRRSI